MKRVLMAVLLSGTAYGAIPTPERPITDPKQLVSPVNSETGPVPIADLAYTRGYLDAAWSTDGKAVFVVTNLTGRYNLWRTDAAGSWPVQMIQGEDPQTDLAPSPDGTLVYAQDAGGNEYYDLYAIPQAGGMVRRLTNTPEVSESRPYFSVDGRQLAIHVREKSQTSTNVAILDRTTGQVRTLTTEKIPEFNWTIVRWTPDGTAIIANRGDIAFTQSSVWQIDVATGRAEELTPSKGALIYASDISADGKTLAITSNEGTGQLRAGMFDLGTRQFRWLTATPWEQYSGTMSPDGKTMVVGTGIDGRDTLSLVEVATGKERPLALPPGVNSEAPSGNGVFGTRGFAPDNRHFLYYHASADTPGELYVADTNSGTSRALTRLSMASLDSARLPKSTIVTFRSFDDTAISAIVTVPFNLQRDGTNPAVVIPHGGPTSQSKDYFSKAATALASRGYLVIQPNFRGSTGYGKAFQIANMKDLGGGDLRDVIAAKDFLVASGYVDPRKVGITGGSYGGFMTLMALGKTPEAFAAGAQWFGIINWHTMWTAGDASLREYQRTLVGDPEKDAALYAAQSPMTYLSQAKAPLLSLQGENDIRVPRGQAQEVADLLKSKGVVTETIFYPEEGHGFYKRENQIDSLERTVAWFDRHLKGLKN